MDHSKNISYRYMDQLRNAQPLDPPVPAPDPSVTKGEEILLQAVSLDGRQMSALRHLGQELPLMVSGSRGTGKTQLALGLITNAVAAGQSVLCLASCPQEQSALLDRLKELGLDRLCLSLPLPGESVTEQLLMQINTAIQRKVISADSSFFSLSQQNTQLTQRLDRYVDALHQPGRCGFSPYQLVCLYLSEPAPEEGLLPMSITMLSRLELEETQQQLDAMEELVNCGKAVEQPWCHPLTPVRGQAYSPQLAEEMTQLTRQIIKSAEQLLQVGQQWCLTTGLPLPDSRVQWQQLTQCGRLLTQWENYPSSWTGSPRLPLLKDTVEELRQRFQTAQQLEETIRKRWDSRVFSMDGVKLEQHWSYLQSDWTLPTEPEEELRLRDLLAQADTLLDGLDLAGRQWSNCVQIPLPTTRDSWERNYEVALELSRWKDIPSEWGSCSSLQALLWDVGELIDHGKRAKESKEVLLRDWEPELLTKNAQQLLDQWQTEGGAWGLGWLKPNAQSPLRSELEPLCRCKLTPDLLENSLHWLADLQYEISECDIIYHRWTDELSSVYQKEDTQWIWLETARVVAAESHDWLAELTGSSDFLRRFGSNAEAVAAADRLQGQWEKLRSVLHQLDEIMGRSSQSDSRDWLSARRSDCKRLHNLLEIRKALEESALEPLSLGEIGDQLALFSQHQQERSTIAALYDRWNQELHECYYADETDWDQLTALSQEAVSADDQLTEITGQLEFRTQFSGDLSLRGLSHGLTQIMDQLEDCIARLETLLDADLSHSPELTWLEALTALCTMLEEQLPALPHWMNWNRQRQVCLDLKLDSLVEHYLSPIAPEEDTLSLFRKSFFHALLQLELDWKPELKHFSGLQFAKLLQEYAQLEDAQSRLIRQELCAIAGHRLQELIRQPDMQPLWQRLGQFNQDSAKEEPQLAQLLAELWPLLSQLFPILLSSPESAQTGLLPMQAEDDPLFDYLICSDADRMAAQSCCPLLALGRTPLLQGSGRQSLFSAATLWEQGEDCGVPILNLPVCYLIRPKGMFFLTEKRTDLITYPSPHPYRHCIRLQPVVGQLEGQQNFAEADAIAARLRSLINEGKTDLAVVALTGPQAESIRRLLRSAHEEEPLLAQIPVLTGEELGDGCWEQVIFSLTIAHDADHSMEPGCALFARQGGTLPLEWAMTAALDSFLLFSSLDRQELELLASQEPLMRELFAYAAQPPVPMPRTSRMERIAQELQESLEQRGLIAAPADWPLALQIFHPHRRDQVLLGILLDDSSYGQICRTYERELIRLRQLQLLGWNLCPVWTMDWFSVKDRVLHQITTLADHLLTRPVETAPPSVPSASPAAKPALYQPAQLTVMGIRDNEVADPAFQNRVYRVVEQILEQEAPVSVPQLTEKMLSAFGLDSTDLQLQLLCSKLWRKLGLQITSEEELSYVWLPQQEPDRFSGFRVSGREEHYRHPNDISQQESLNALLSVLNCHETMLPHLLLRDTALALGYPKDDPAALHCAQRGLDYGLYTDRLRETPLHTIILTD